MVRCVSVSALTFLLFIASSFSVFTVLHAQPQTMERYIVVLHPQAQDPEAVAGELVRAQGGQVGFVYESAIRGFSAQLPAGAVAAIGRDPRVRYIEKDRPVRLFAQEFVTGVDRIYQPDSTDTSAASLGIDGVDDVRVDVDVAIIDTGIDYQHADLNVVGGTDCTQAGGGGPPWARGYVCVDGPPEGDDDHYHGTHVAGTVGALDNDVGVVGVAPGARLWAVKVLDANGSGYESMVVAGIDWVTANAGTVEVANMSLGGAGYSQAEQDAISAAKAAGVVFVVAAGNDDDDAANYSPAGLLDVVTVSALADFDGVSGGAGSPTCRSDSDDTLADFSNWGSRVDIAAPGVCITSTYPVERGEYGTISGTSMASPHVAGAAALLASGANKPQDAADVDALVATLLADGNYNWVDDSGDGIQEPLLDISAYSPSFVVTEATANTAPEALFSATCDGLSCEFDGSASYDPDGSLSRYDWDFGDEATGSGELVSHGFASDGTYSVTLTVTDNEGATGRQTQPITVSSGSAAPIDLTLTGYKEKGMHQVDLSWSGASGSSVDIYRDGRLLATTDNSGAYTDATTNRGGATYTYSVCESGTTTCSAEKTVVF